MENIENEHLETPATQFQSRIDMTELRESLEKIKAEIGKVIVGQESMIEHLLAALLSNGHVLIEGVPGVAKTITAKLLAKTISVDFSRIQFTPDLMPSDILGTSVFNMKTSEFEFKKGPIFSNFILIDEINRSPAKTQAALFEVMEAYWLYGIKEIEAVIEPTSAIHAVVEFIDGSSTMHLSRPDMKLAIAHAMFENVSENIVSHANLLDLKNIKFHKISLKKYPIFSLKDKVLANPDLGVVINAANEVGVFSFLEKKCSFLDISRLVLSSVKNFRDIKISNIDEIFEADKEVRNYAKRMLNAKV